MPYDPDATPKVAGSYGRWPLFRETATALAEACARRAMRLEKPTVDVSITKARRLRAIGKSAAALAEAFAAWEHGDPGQDLRSAAVVSLLDLRAEAQELGVDTVAAFEKS